MSVIRQLTGLEVLDSRGRPTVRARCLLASGATGTASVPSGASTGRAEAVELRDGNASRYAGLGCLRAVAGIGDEIGPAVRGVRFAEQLELDRRLVALDGTPDKRRLGANAILAVSLAFARAQAVERNLPLYAHLQGLTGSSLDTLPALSVNLFSGGKHAGGQVAIQDVLVVPHAATSIAAALAITFDVYRAASELTREKYGMRLLRADEGGMAPPFPDTESMLDDAVAAIERAGYTPGQEVSLAIDVAASHFHHHGRYRLNGSPLSGAEMIDVLRGWCRTYPIVSIEDGLAEDDWTHWSALLTELGDRTMLIGDDLLCTNPERIRRAIDHQAANALLLKVNQIGTLTEAAEACGLARAHRWGVVISARSGETEDDWLADLAVGWQGDFLKVGSITQSDRLAKYNRLLEIEADNPLPLAQPGARR